MRARIGIGIAVVISLCVVYGAFVEYRYVERAHAVDFFSSALASADISTTVTVGRTRYSINDGVVVSQSGAPAAATTTSVALRLAYAQTLAERSPIAAIPGTDPDSLDAVTTVLTSIQQDLANSQSSKQDASAVTSALYPIDLLHAIANAEHARLQFIQSGSDTDEKAYEAAQQTELQTYKKDLSLFVNAFQATVPANSADYEVFEGTISRASILATVNNLQSSVEHTEQLLNARDACIAGSFTNCDPSELEMPTLTATSTPETSVSTTPYLQEIRSAYAQATGDPSYDKGDGIELSNSVCLQALNTDPLFMLMDMRKSNALTLGVQFIGDVEFIPAAEYSDVGYYMYVSQHDISYAYFPVWEPYKCLDLAGETSRVFDVNEIQEIAAKQPFSVDVTNTTDVQELRTLEKSLTDPKGGIVQENDALAYLSDARRSLSEQNNVATSTEYRLANAILAANDHSQQFDLFIRQIVDDEALNIGLVQNNVPTELGAEYLFYVQSEFFGLFMGANPSFAGQVEPIESSLGTSTLPFVSYSTLRATVPESELVRDMTFFFSIHRQASTLIPID